MAEAKLDDRLNGDREEETQEELQVAYKKLSELAGPDGSVVRMSKESLSMMKQMIHGPEKYNDLTQILLICDFLSEDEANDELNAFYEAKRYGMDTQYNVDHALSRASINRKGGHSSSRVAVLLETLGRQKFSKNGQKERHVTSNPRSPIGE